MNRPKIAILALHPSNGGGVLSSLRVVYDFCSKKFEPIVFCLSFDPEISAHIRPLSFTSSIRRSVIEGMNCVEIGSRWAFWEPWHYAATMRAWRNELASYEYFFVTSGTCIVAYPLIQLKKKFVLWVASTHEDDRIARQKELSWFRRLIESYSLPRMKNIECKILLLANKILPISSYAGRTLAALDDRIKVSDIVPYPMDPVRNQYVIKSKLKDVVAVGRFDDPRKNIEMLLNVWQQIYARLPDARLTIVGRQPNRSVLEKYDSLLVTGSVLFTGIVSEVERDNILERSVLMLITSYQEGLGIVGLEAFAHSVPVVSTRCGGSQDYVIDGSTGFLVDVNDDKRMVELAVRLLKLPSLAQAMGRAGKKLLQSNFSQKHVFDLFKKNILEVWPELSVNLGGGSFSDRLST